MLHGRTIILVEDDEDDIFIFREAMKILKNESPVLTFSTGRDAYEYMVHAQEIPAMIICDMQLNAEHGIDLRKRLADDPKVHNMTIPFVFITTSITEKQIRKAYELPVQGIFLKPDTIEALADRLAKIFDYWTDSLQPDPNVKIS